MKLKLKDFWTRAGEILAPLRTSLVYALTDSPQLSEPWVKVESDTTYPDIFKATVYDPNGRAISSVTDTDHKVAVLRAWDRASKCRVYTIDDVKKFQAEQ